MASICLGLDELKRAQKNAKAKQAWPGLHIQYLHVMNNLLGDDAVICLVNILQKNNHYLQLIQETKALTFAMEVTDHPTYHWLI